LDLDGDMKIPAEDEVVIRPGGKRLRVVKYLLGTTQEMRYLFIWSI
jgi:hypothetical protein